MATSVFKGKDRLGLVIFWLGTLGVTFGVISHIPMFLDAAPNGYKMVGMPMCTEMLVGMATIVLGTIAAGYGLMPAGWWKKAKTQQHVDVAHFHEEGDGRLTAAHWQLLVVLMAALVIDTMKPATLGFVVPGTMKEYDIAKPMVAWLPFSGLSGTALGSWLWGILADKMGRRAAILLAAIMFIGTSICGAMPTFEWNLIMCFVMGLSAGGMLPIAYTLLAETIPTKHRGWTLVLLGGVGLVGGFFAASGLASLLEPHFGWRVLWLVGLPTGLLLIFFNRFIPESPRFLIMTGREEEAKAVMARFGRTVKHVSVPKKHHDVTEAGSGRLFRAPLLTQTLTLNLAALAWGLVNFGLLLWMPANLRAAGYDVTDANKLLFQSSLLALPTSVLTAWLYTKWSTKWTLVMSLLLTIASLGGLTLLGTDLTALHISPLVILAVLMTGANAVIAVLLPYSAENYPLYIRGRGTGLVAASSKAGGIVAQIVNMLAAVPTLAVASLVLAAPVAFAAMLTAAKGRETRGLNLEQLDK